MICYQKNPRKTKSVITVDGKEYVAKYIGKGQYSKVYRVGDRVVYYTRGDCGKEVLAQFQYDRMAHLPEMIRHENMTTVRGTWYVFSSPYYRNVKSSDTSAWKMMKRIMDNGSAYFQMHYAMGVRGIYLMQAIVNSMKEHSSSYGPLPRSVIRALQEIVNIASNCGQGVGFDLHKKNFGVNEYGTLIFRDLIYVRE
jgi:hypothetical protein